MTNTEHIERAVKMAMRGADMMAKASREFRKAGVNVAGYFVDTIEDGCSSEPLYGYHSIRAELWGGITNLSKATGREIEYIPDSVIAKQWLAMDEVMMRFCELPPEPCDNDTELRF